MQTVLSTPQVFPETKKHYRIDTIDFLRGLVMVIMALDHTRDYFHILAFTGDPVDLNTTTAPLFLTRWITHFCAPVFVFLSGASIYLQSLRKSRSELQSFLLKRGLWLIFVELVIVTFGITFDISFSTIILQVIWAIGISMVILGLLIRLPFKIILILGLAIVLLHNILDFYEARVGGQVPIWYSFLHRPTILSLSSQTSLGIFYPFLPWTGLMLLGYCFGKIYAPADADARKRTLYIGAAVIIFFIILRFSNLYGDPLPWSQQRSLLFTVFSFVNTQKYPPSLLYMCMTIGPALLLLGTLRHTGAAFYRWITVYGRVPFFYYILHFYILHLLTAIAFFARGHSLKEGIEGIPGFPFRFQVPAEGYSLGVVYLVWLFVVILLYPLCKWFSNYKMNHRKWWLSYL